MLKIIYSAVDTIECSFRGTLKNERVKEFDAAKNKARDEVTRSTYDKAAEKTKADHEETIKKADAEHARIKFEKGFTKRKPKEEMIAPEREITNEVFIAGERFLVRPHSAGIYSYMAYNARFDLKITPSPKIGYFVLARIRSITLHELGATKAIEELYEIIKELSMNETIDAKVSRIDLCADFQGWQPKMGDIDKFVCKAKLDKAIRNKKELGTLMFGKGNMLARLYNKTEEIKEHRKEWFVPIWRESEAFKEGLPVWRLEFQLRRPKLKEFGIDTLEDAMRALKGVWEYGLSWLELRKPTKNKQPTRWPIDKKWVTLKEKARFEGKALIKVRRYKRQKDAERLVKGFGGYLTSLAALYGDATETEAFLRAQILYRNYLTDRSLDFEHLVKVKIEMQEEDLPF